MEKAVFLDRDGTIIKDPGYLWRIDEVEFLPGAAEAIRKLNEGGYKAVVVTNQAGVARGYFTEQDVKEVNEFIRESLAENGAVLDRFYYCPHHVDGIIEEYRKDCGNRKPNPGMIRQAARDMDIELSGSWTIGDNESDIEAGRRAGCRTVLLSRKQVETNADFIAPGLPEAAGIVLEQEPGGDREE